MAEELDPLDAYMNGINAEVSHLLNGQSSSSISIVAGAADSKTLLKTEVNEDIIEEEDDVDPSEADTLKNLSVEEMIA